MGRIQNIWRSLVGNTEQLPQPQAHFTGQYRHLYSQTFDGEKNLGEIGPAKNYIPDYELLRIRSWQSYLESEITQTVMNKSILWMVSKGLKLEAEPSKVVLESESIDLDIEKFSRITEARFSLWGKSKMCSHNKMTTLSDIAKQAYKDSKIGGDVLVVLRLEKGVPTVQLIDGAHVKTPMNKLMDPKVKYGIQYSDNGEHEGYWISTSSLDSQYIPAKNKSTGLRTAYMVYGNRFRIDSHRGMPLIAACLETLKKLERYKEATVGSAEERQKIVMQIIHDANSTGDDPMIKNIANAYDVGNSSDMLPKDVNGEQLSNRVAATTNKQVFNMPIGSKLQALESKNELYFKEFYETNFNIVCAMLAIPPNVATSVYNDSFSASRAATKDWEHTITVGRDDFGNQFYQPIYEFWLHTEVLKNKIAAPGYLGASYSNEYMVLEAYRTARFTGPMFPHIDPLKEVQAERAKLGPLADDMPLTTLEKATEALNAGDSDANMSQFKDELARYAEGSEEQEED